MTDLPASIEAALQEAGFSGTEIIVLKKLLQEDALTLRELAGKTGKSTGVLDAAVKKLLKKGIVTKEIINSHPKYVLHSLQPIADWMDQDLRSKQAVLMRKHGDFMSFMTSITVNQSQPTMEYFEGLEGIKKVYRLLLDGSSETRHYLPVRHKEEDDPLADFRKKYIAERREKEIFSRIIAEDSPLGRRFQSQDPFCFRKTCLVSKDRYPFFIEQIISGGKIAYIDHEKEKACILHFPDLAHYDGLFFEADWANALLNNDVALQQNNTMIEQSNIPNHSL